MVPQFRWFVNCFNHAEVLRDAGSQDRTFLPLWMGNGFTGYCHEVLRAETPVCNPFVSAVHSDGWLSVQRKRVFSRLQVLHLDGGQVIWCITHRNINTPIHTHKQSYVQTFTLDVRSAMRFYTSVLLLDPARYVRMYLLSDEAHLTK